MAEFKLSVRSFQTNSVNDREHNQFRDSCRDGLWTRSFGASS